jgi:arylsulfatase A-like enzyme
MMKDDISRRDLLACTSAGVALGLAPSAFAASPRRARRPNILFILADDLGYADLSCYGREDYATPHLDGLAREGLKLSQAYANSSVCSPTRLALATGRYQYRLAAGLDEPLGRNLALGLAPGIPTLPSRLRDTGYATSLVGKWHLGTLPDFGPLKSGYQRFFGSYGGGVDYFTHALAIRGVETPDLFDGETAVKRNGYLTDMLTDRAIGELDHFAANDAPFLLSLHYTSPHWPWEGPQDQAIAQSIRDSFHYDGGSARTYAEMVTNLDTNVGRVLAHLARKGLARDTIVIFTSDNGGERFSKNWPFIGMKGELLEGGIRVPALMRWPDRIGRGATSSQVMASMDWLPTLLAAAGGPMPAPDQIDGVDLLPVLTGGHSPTPRTLYWRHKANDQSAMRQGDLKYLSLGGHEYLFDLSADPRERANLKSHQPERFAAMQKAFAAWNATMMPYPADTFSYDFHDKGTVADRY